MSHKNRKESRAGKAEESGAPGCDAGPDCDKEASAPEERMSAQAVEEQPSDALEQMARQEQSLSLPVLLQRLEEAGREAEKNRDLYLRAVADLDTYRRKVQREKDELAKFAVAPLIEEMLQPLDHLEMAIAAAKAANEAPSLTTGVEMVRSQVNKILESYGVKEVCAEGMQFDPQLEDCVAHEPSDEVPENVVIKVMRRGYTLNGRLVRPASVVVSSGPSDGGKNK